MYHRDNSNCGNTLPLYSNDMPTIPENFNLCKSMSMIASRIETKNLLLPFILLSSLDGVQPFYMEMSITTGNAHGVFLKNSNGMDVVLQQNALQYKIIGGINMKTITMT